MCFAYLLGFPVQHVVL